MRGEKVRDPKRIDDICEQLRIAWHEYPDERLGQFLMNAAWFYGINDDKHTFFNIEDDKWTDILNAERSF